MGVAWEPLIERRPANPGTKRSGSAHSSSLQQPVAAAGFAQARALRRGERRAPRRGFIAHEILRLVVVLAAIHQHVRVFVSQRGAGVARRGDCPAEADTDSGHRCGFKATRDQGIGKG